MIHFLSPFGLLSLLAVAIPIAIHLLSRKPGKIIKVGSLQFLTSSASARFKSLKPSELSLLLVRMVIIILLALLLARPVWLNKNSAGKKADRGWVLIAPPLLPASPHAQISPQLDSLAAAGHELHLLAPGFPEVSPGDALQVAHEQNYWSLLREVDQMLPGQMPVWIFATDRLSDFQGDRPQLQREFHWQTYGALHFTPSAISTGRAPQRSDPKDSIRVAVAYSSERKEEAEYVKTALAVAAEANAQHLRLNDQIAESDEQHWKNVDLIFWLRADSLPARVAQSLERGSVLVTTASAQAYETCESLMVMPQTELASFPRLWRRSAPSRKGAPVWTDGYGAPLLEAERQGLGRHYRFASRFDPVWNELVLHPAFPEWMLSLLSRRDVFETHQSHQHDQSRISAAQSAPQRNVHAPPRSGSSSQRLHLPLWLLAALLFGMERWMSDRKKN